LGNAIAAEEAAKVENDGNLSQWLRGIPLSVVSLRHGRAAGGETGAVDRRGFLLGATGLLLAGCARVQPTGESQQTSTPSPSGPIIAIESGAVGTVLGALLTGALAVDATSQALSTDWTTPLGDGTWKAAAVYATTAWNDLSDSDDPPGDDVASQLAGLVEPKISELNAGVTDGAVIWMAATTAGVTSLDDLAAWSAGKVAVVPSWALDRADGLQGLNAGYQTTFTSVTEDDPTARAQAIASGQVAIGAFRRTEYYGTASLLELADPNKMSNSDLLTLLVNAAYVDEQPEQVLSLTKVIQTLTTADLVSLQKQVADGGQVADVAHTWLVAKGVTS
jgi:hypothetical protein